MDTRWFADLNSPPLNSELQSKLSTSRDSIRRHTASTTEKPPISYSTCLTLLNLNYIRLTLADFMTTNEVEIRSAFFVAQKPTGGGKMYLEPNNPSLSFANFLDAAIRDKAEIKPFSYTLEVCRCRYCSYCQKGKCALKRCCCIPCITL